MKRPALLVLFVTMCAATYVAVRAGDAEPSAAGSDQARTVPGDPKNKDKDHSTLYCLCPSYRMYAPTSGGTSFWYCLRAECTATNTNGECTNYDCPGEPVGEYLPNDTSPGACNATCSDQNCDDGMGHEQSAPPSGELGSAPERATLETFGFEYDRPGRNAHIQERPKELRRAALSAPRRGGGQVPIELFVSRISFANGQDDVETGFGTEVTEFPDGVDEARLIAVHPVDVRGGRVPRLYLVYARLRGQDRPDAFYVRTRQPLKLTSP
ncbi:MAG TPA: hypothetical protein VF170_11895 [Planctomycetaceae bacterium]